MTNAAVQCRYGAAVLQLRSDRSCFWWDVRPLVDHQTVECYIHMAASPSEKPPCIAREVVPIYSFAIIGR